jgi:hypothetical protein
MPDNLRAGVIGFGEIWGLAARDFGIDEWCEKYAVADPKGKCARQHAARAQTLIPAPLTHKKHKNNLRYWQSLSTEGRDKNEKA